MEEKILDILAETAGVPREKITADTRLVADLGLSSFDLADTVVLAEEAYGIRIPDTRFREMETAGDILRILQEENGQ